MINNNVIITVMDKKLSLSSKKYIVKHYATCYNHCTTDLRLTHHLYTGSIYTQKEIKNDKS